MDRRPIASSADPVIVGTREFWIAGVALAHIAVVIVLREYHPTAHDIWIAATEIFTRGAAHVFVVIDSHAESYRNILSDSRIAELRSIYAVNRAFALIIVSLALMRAFTHGSAFEWHVWKALHLRAKWAFLVGLALLPTAPIAVYGLFLGFAEVNFFEFELGINMVDRDIYYFLDFLLFLIVAWQFLYFIPAVTYFTGKVAYANLASLSIREYRERRRKRAENRTST